MSGDSTGSKVDLTGTGSNSGSGNGSGITLQASATTLVSDQSGMGSSVSSALVSRAHPCYRALRNCGYVPGPHRFRFLVHGDAPAQWALTWASTDHV